MFTRLSLPVAGSMLFILAACGASNDHSTPASTVTTPASQSAQPTLAPTTSTAPAPSYAPLTSADFIGYTPSGKPGEWKPNNPSGQPILRANSTQVTAFVYKGVTCEVTLLNDVQATPARVLLMFATMKNGGDILQRGVFDYTMPAVGGGMVTVGTYDCR